MTGAEVRATTGFEPVASVGDLPAGTLKRVLLADGTAICLANHQGALFALRDLCTHAAFPLSAGYLLENGAVECGWHGAQFDCATGAACRGPADDAVFTYDVTVEDGRILVRSVPRQ
jgi:3-phenylpropionate/trans-cinnamate dioxygenase ferredoxin subunit